MNTRQTNDTRWVRRPDKRETAVLTGSRRKSCGPFFCRSRVSDGELLVQMLRATLSVCFFTALYRSYQRVFNESGTKKRERSGIAWLNNNGRQENGEPHEQGSLSRPEITWPCCSTNNHTSCRNNEWRNTEYNEIETSQANKCEFVTSVLLCQFEDQWSRSLHKRRAVRPLNQKQRYPNASKQRTQTPHQLLHQVLPFIFFPSIRKTKPKTVRHYSFLVRLH